MTKPLVICLLLSCIFPVSALLPPMSRSSFFKTSTKFIGGAVLAGAAAVAVQRAQQPPIFTPNPNSLSDKTILITGASTGLGLESAKRLAVGGASIILTARSDGKGQAAVQAVQDYLKEKSVENSKISYKILDLDNLKSIQEDVKSWTDINHIDVLLNNAGVMALPERELTVDGYEKQIQSNHLGHFLLTALLAPKLSPKARIVNVSSEAHKFASGGLDFDYFWKADNGYGPWCSYGQSKLANILFTQELQRRADTAGKEWSIVALHPGAVGTDLGRNLVGTENWNKLKEGKAPLWQTALAKSLNVFIKTVEQGATTQVWLAAGAEDVDVKGQYLSDCKVRTLGAFATDQEAAKTLWKQSEEKAGVAFNLEAQTTAAS